MDDDDDYLDDQDNKAVKLSFEVIKQHHSIGVLRQKRILLVTENSVLNCKPGSGGKPDEVTKTLKFNSITSVAVAGTDKFCLNVEGDHVYYYSAPNALYIAFVIHSRVLASKTVKRLVRGTDIDDEEEAILMKSFCRGELHVPHQCDIERPRLVSSAAAQSDVIPLIAVINSIKKQFKEGCFGGLLNKGKTINSIFSAEIEAEGMCIAELFTRLRLQLDSFRVELRASIPKFTNGDDEDLDDDLHCKLRDEITEDEILDHHLTVRLWNRHLERAEIKEEQIAFDAASRVLAAKPPNFFGVPVEFHSLRFDLVISHMRSLSGPHQPHKLLQILVLISKTIVLTVAATSRIWEERKKRGSLPPAMQTSSLSADDILPLYIHLLVTSNSSNIVFVKEWISALANLHDSNEQAYHFTVFCSAISYVLEFLPP